MDEPKDQQTRRRELFPIESFGNFAPDGRGGGVTQLPKVNVRKVTRFLFFGEHQKSS